MPQDLTDDKSTLFQLMAWCRQATSHYLNQCWPRSPTPYSVTRNQWVNNENSTSLALNHLYRRQNKIINSEISDLITICYSVTLQILPTLPSSNKQRRLINPLCIYCGYCNSKYGSFILIIWMIEIFGFAIFTAREFSIGHQITKRGNVFDFTFNFSTILCISLCFPVQWDNLTYELAYCVNL